MARQLDLFDALGARATGAVAAADSSADAREDSSVDARADRSADSRADSSAVRADSFSVARTDSSAVASFDASFASLARIDLGLGAWIDRAPGWVANHQALFDELARDLPWRAESRPMYTRVVEVPRLLASVGGHSLIEKMRLALCDRYGEDFVRLNAALYRDGRDSVAFHGDTTARDMVAATVATISLGTPRKFLVKPTEGGRSQAFALGGGDLVVMGGTCQRTWRHAIPKLAGDVGPRIAVMFRPIWSAAQTK